MSARGTVLALAALYFAGCGRAPDSATSADRPPLRARIVCTGSSMLPTFAVVEEVQLELCAFSDLRARDTVIFWHDQSRQWVHHRLDYRDPRDGRWVTRGDNNRGVDTGRMTSDEFAGRTHKLPR